MRKYEGRRLYGFYATTPDEGIYLLTHRENCVKKATTEYKGGKIYFFDLDRDAK